MVTVPQLARGGRFQRAAGLPTPSGTHLLVLLWHPQAETHSSFRCLQDQQRLLLPRLSPPHSQLPIYRCGLVILKRTEHYKGHITLVNLT